MPEGLIAALPVILSGVGAAATAAGTIYGIANAPSGPTQPSAKDKLAALAQQSKSKAASIANTGANIEAAAPYVSPQYIAKTAETEQDIAPSGSAEDKALAELFGNIYGDSGTSGIAG